MNEQILAYVNFINELNGVSLAITQQGSKWLVEVNGQAIFAVPDEKIAQSLVDAFQMAALPAVQDARKQAKANLIALIDGL